MTTEQHQPAAGTIWYPENDVLAVIDDPAQIDAAIAELRAAGVHVEDIQVVHGQDVIERVDASGAHCGLMKHVMWFLASVLSEEREYAREYEAEGRAGHDLIAVHVHAADRIEQVRQILEAHGGHDIKFFGHWAISALPSRA